VVRRGVLRRADSGNRLCGACIVCRHPFCAEILVKQIRQLWIWLQSIAWLALICGVEIAGLVACSKIPGIGGDPSPPVFNVIELPDSHHVYEFRLKDGTHCAAVQSSITCDWNNK
jgi:hypothetical protein